MLESQLESVLASWPGDCRPGQVESLGAAGGFSGARFWRVTAQRGLLCLRRWPSEHPSPSQLEFIHAVLAHVDRQGFKLAPLPLPTMRATTFVSHGDHFWELSPWLPGEPHNFAQPNELRLRAAMTALARFHRAAESFPLPEPRVAVSPSIAKRLKRLDELARGELARLASAVRPATWPAGVESARRLTSLFPQASQRVAASLHAAMQFEVSLQPCLRDVWSDHVLFAGQEVSGLIDFGAMQPECVAADVARLLGSIAQDDPQMWQAGMQAYEAIRPLSPAERKLVTAFDQSFVLLGGFNWIDWIYQQQRHFDQLETIAQRLERLASRLQVLAAQA